LALSVLISGAGIAGLAVARPLALAGHRVVAVDRARQFDSRGYGITIKGTGAEVLRRTGLYDALLAHRFMFDRIRGFDKSGNRVREYRTDEAEEKLGGYVMTRRADLHETLLSVLPGSVQLRFDTTITGVHQDSTAVQVKFSRGPPETFDLVLGCDGVHSELRQLAFPDVVEKPLGGHYVTFVVELAHGLDKLVAHAVFDLGRNINLLPVDRERVAVLVYQDDRWPAPPSSSKGRAWRDYFLTDGSDHPDFVMKVLASIPDDLYVFADKIIMIPAKRLVDRRIALVGDAGYCPTFLSGMGAAAALQGSYCLAAQIDKHADPTQALRLYEQRILPVVTAYQKSARLMRGLLLTRSPAKRWLLNNALRYVSTRQLSKRAQRFYHSEVDIDELAS
jgi:2-polyprenyl-6-methoxyphenol hydroxylase-like FAD-dependent oxidoreductase